MITSWKYMAFCDLHVLFYLYLYLNAEDIIIKRVIWESIKSFIHKAGPKFLVRWAIAITWCLLPRACLYIFVKITSVTRWPFWPNLTPSKLRFGLCLGHTLAEIRPWISYNKFKHAAYFTITETLKKLCQRGITLGEIIISNLNRNLSG
jgi:hypothetical protein